MADELLTTSRDPEHATCRKLVELGHAGHALFLRGERPGMWMHIEHGALRTVSENARHGPRTIKYSAYEPAHD